MPQATPELHQKMKAYFGDEIDDIKPWEFLKSQGYTERKWVIHKPSKDYVITDKEFDCIDFLIQEWDWGFHHEE